MSNQEYLETTHNVHQLFPAQTLKEADVDTEGATVLDFTIGMAPNDIAKLAADQAVVDASRPPSLIHTAIELSPEDVLRLKQRNLAIHGLPADSPIPPQHYEQPTPTDRILDAVVVTVTGITNYLTKVIKSK